MNGEVTAVVTKKAIQVFKEQRVMGRYMIGSSGEDMYWSDLTVCVLSLSFKQARKDMVWKLQEGAWKAPSFETCRIRKPRRTT